MPATIGKILITLGIVMIIAGIILVFFKSVPVGRLPGDFHFQKGNFSFYFPLTTSILISIIITAILYFFGKK